MKNRAHLLVLSLIITAIASNTRAESLPVAPIVGSAGIMIPLPDYKKDLLGAPANDLIYQGHAIDSDEAVDLIHKGIDISNLEPAANDAWKAAPQKTNNNDEFSFPAEGTVLDFKDNLALSNRAKIYRATVGLKTSNGDYNYHFLLSKYSHGALLRNALLRKLGYTSNTPKFYKKLTIRFQSVEQKNDIIDQIETYTDTDAAERWIVDTSSDKLSVTFRSVVLEVPRVNVPQLHWGVINENFLVGKRAMRALIAPYALADLTENVNLFSWDAGKVNSEHVFLSSFYADTFTETTYEDVRWLLRSRIAKLTRQDFVEIAKNAALPEDIQTLIVEKLVSRRNHLLELFDLSSLQNETHNPLVSLGNVKSGKLINNPYAKDYAARFTYGDPKSPLSLGEVFRFFKSEAASVGLRQLISRVNDEIPKKTIGEAYKKFFESEFKSMFQHNMSNPQAPYAFPVRFWGGPVADMNFFANRSVVTGTYYGIDNAKIQLVDTVATQVNLGYFLSRDTLPKVFEGKTLGLQPNLSLIRTYTHVRPVVSVQESEHESWKKLNVPHFMKQLGDLLNPKLEDKKRIDGIQKFVNELKEEEIFTVSDTINMGVSLNASLPILSMLDIPAKGPSVLTAQASSNRITLRKTTFRKMADGKVQVYIQHLNSTGKQFSMDFSYYINLLRLSWQSKNTAPINAEGDDPTTRIFNLDLQSSDTDEQKLNANAIFALLHNNNSDKLVKTHKDLDYNLFHELHAKISKHKFLWWKWDKLDESHVVVVRKPFFKQESTNEDGEKVNQLITFDRKATQRTLYSNRIVSRKGNDYYDFVGDVIDYYKPGYSPRNGGSSGDPSTSLMGTSQTTEIRSEAEITEGAEFAPVTIVTTAWKGWVMSKNKLMALLDKLEDKVKNLIPRARFIRRENFKDMNHLQLYDIHTNLLVYREGIKTLMNYLYPTGGEPELLNSLIKLVGEAKFKQFCSAFKDNPNGPQRFIHGKYTFSCALPWMKKILVLTTTRPTDDKRKQVEWTNQLIDVLYKNIPLETLVHLLGQNNLYFDVGVSGFRTKDENGDSTFVSDSIGIYDTKIDNGAFADMAQKENITDYEIRARYFSEGF